MWSSTHPASMPSDKTDVRGAHLSSSFDEVFLFQMQDGTIMAAADRFWVNITGKGGHAAMPHLSIDPVVAASQVRRADTHKMLR